MEHDELCPGRDPEAMCLCSAHVADSLIARVRADERTKAAGRVRVETLREVKTAVMHLPVVGRLAGTDSTLAAVHVLAAIDRLINAATTGDTDD